MALLVSAVCFSKFSRVGNAMYIPRDQLKGGQFVLVCTIERIKESQWKSQHR